MNIWLVPTQPQHLDTCLATGLHGTNAPSGKLINKGDLFLTYLVGSQEIISLNVVNIAPFPGEIVNDLWDTKYDLVWSFQTLNTFEPLPVSWKGLPGGSPCKYGFTAPGTGPKKLTPQMFAAILEDLT